MNKYLKQAAFVLIAAVGFGVWKGWPAGAAFVAFWVALEAFEHIATKPRTR
jgi:hypothetical protein